MIECLAIVCVAIDSFVYRVSYGRMEDLLASRYDSATDVPSGSLDLIHRLWLRIVAAISTGALKLTCSRSAKFRSHLRPKWASEPYMDIILADTSCSSDSLLCSFQGDKSPSLTPSDTSAAGCLLWRFAVGA